MWYCPVRSQRSGALQGGSHGWSGTTREARREPARLHHVHGGGRRGHGGARSEARGRGAGPRGRRRRHGHAHPPGQRHRAPGGGRAAHDAPRGAAGALGADRRQARLRAGGVWGVHRPRGRGAALRLHDAGPRGRGRRRHDRGGSARRRDAGARTAGLRREGRLPVRLLHLRPGDGRGGAASQAQGPDLGGDPGGRERQPLPLRRLRPHLRVREKGRGES